MQKELGQGASGRVFLVTDTDGDSYVVKQMNSRDVITIKHLLNQECT